jgi:ribosomal protein S4E
MQQADLFKLGNAFLALERIQGITFEHNDYVRIIDGSYVGHKGTLVNISAMEPEPRYIVESEAGEDIDVRQADLKLISRE